jgi:formate hydrogenlyase subunit 3/multisubunit Na+/H+ antiporter MnhD subunit
MIFTYNVIFAFLVCCASPVITETKEEIAETAAFKVEKGPKIESSAFNLAKYSAVCVVAMFFIGLSVYYYCIREGKKAEKRFYPLGMVRRG